MVRLQRPLPVTSSLRPSELLRSNRVTAAPCQAAKRAAMRPEAPAPMTATEGTPGEASGRVEAGWTGREAGLAIGSIIARRTATVNRRRTRVGAGVSDQGGAA